MQPAIFMDRDGVIIENVETYVRSWQDVQFLPGALDALASLQSSPYLIVVVTNQSAVGRGLISLEQAQNIQTRLNRRIIQAGGRIDGVYMCPHAPQDQCNCRKPMPGLFLQAAAELDIDLQRSIMIGDAISDIEAGRAAGVKRNLLVRTGRGLKQETEALKNGNLPDAVYDNLMEALRNEVNSESSR